MDVQKWRTYLQGHKFVIKTDQQALKHLLDQKITSSFQQKWIAKLLGLDYEIQYKKGVENKVADALSRKWIDLVDCDAITTVTPTWVQQVVNGYAKDEFHTQILEAKVIHSLAYPAFELCGELLRYKGRISLENSNSIREAVLQEVHKSALGGHSGIQGTYMRLKKNFYWPNMKKDVLTWVGLILVTPIAGSKLKREVIQDFCSHCLYHHRLGHTSPWILWRGYPNLMERMSYW